MTLIWTLLCAVLLSWVLMLQARLRHQRRVNRVALAATRHWRQQAMRARGVTAGEAPPEPPARVAMPRQLTRVQRNRGRA